MYSTVVVCGVSVCYVQQAEDQDHVRALRGQHQLETVEAEPGHLHHQPQPQVQEGVYIFVRGSRLPAGQDPAPVPQRPERGGGRGGAAAAPEHAGPGGALQHRPRAGHRGRGGRPRQAQGQEELQGDVRGPAAGAGGDGGGGAGGGEGGGRGSAGAAPRLRQDQEGVQSLHVRICAGGELIATYM